MRPRSGPRGNGRARGWKGRQNGGGSWPSVTLFLPLGCGRGIAAMKAAAKKKKEYTQVDSNAAGVDATAAEDLQPAEFEEVDIHSSNGGGGAKRWTRWAGMGKARAGTSRKAGLKRASLSPDDTPEHWGLTARELGSIETRWRSWASFVHASRGLPRVDVADASVWDRCSLVPVCVALLRRQGVFFGWVVVCSTAMLTAVAGATSEVVLAVVAKPAAKTLGVPAWTLDKSLSLGHLVAASVAPLVGLAVGRLGPSAGSCLCALLLALGYALFAWAQSPVGVALAVAVAQAAATGALTPAATAVLHSWWRTGRRFVSTVVGSWVACVCYGLIPAAVGGHDEWRGFYQGFAALSAFVAAPWVLLLQPRPPSSYAQMPDGESSATFHVDEVLEVADLPAEAWALGDAAKSATFWVVEASYVTLRAHAVGALYLHADLLLGSGLHTVDWLVFVAAGGAGGALIVGLGLDVLPRRHTIVVVALAIDALALWLAASQPVTGSAVAAWSVLMGAQLSVCSVSPSSVWTALYGTVDSQRTAAITGITTLVGAGIGIGSFGVRPRTPVAGGGS